jgi:hypothetical protein
VNDQNWNLSFSRCTRPILPFNQEVLNAAKICAEKAKGKIVVCFSGGIDSEVIVRALHQLKVDFVALSFVYTSDNGWINYHDVWHAENCCKELGIKHTIHEYDLNEFIRTGMDYYYDNKYFRNDLKIYYLLRMEFMRIGKQYGDYIIKGSGEQRFEMIHTPTNTLINGKNHTKYPTDTEVGIMHSPALSNVLRYMKEFGIDGNPYFYYTTPELCAAYQQIPIIDFSLKQPNFYNNWNSTIITKTLAYQCVYPHLTGRKKFNGFEHVSQEYLDLFKEKISKFNDHTPSKIWMPLNQFREQLGLCQI